MRRKPVHLLLLVCLGPVLLGLLLVGCQGFRYELRGPTTSELSYPDDPPNDAVNDNVVSVDRIVYVGTGGDLFTIKGDGTDPQQLTGNNQLRPEPPEPAEPQEPGARQISAALLGQTLNFNQFYAWPTWSPDGTKLAVSRVQMRSEREATVSIQVIDAITGRADTIYTNEVPALIADGVPHYLYWAPDGRSLGFIAATPRGLTLFVSPVISNEGPTTVETGAPLYFSWAQDSRGLLLHSGPEIKLIPNLATGEPSLALGSDDGFRVAAYSPAATSGGPRLAYASHNEDGGLIMVANSGALEQAQQAQPALEVGPFSAFLWSPDGTRLAVADHSDSAGPAFQRLRVVSLQETGREMPVDPQVETIAAEDLLAFYWSPDGQRLAWVALDPEQRLFQWRVSGQLSGSDGADAKDLFRFQPSGEFFTLLSFFDQYAYSHYPWSPDSSQLVVAGSPEQAFERRNGHTPTGSRIFVLDVAGDNPPLEIAAGTLAFWSQN